MSLVVVASAQPRRAQTVPLGEVAAQWPIIANLLGGSLLGAWFGAVWAIRFRLERLYRVIAVLLVMIAVVLLLGHNATVGAPLFGGTALAVIGVFSGFTRYSRDQSFAVLGRNRIFLIIMAAGSILGTFIGRVLLGIVPSIVPLPGLALILINSAIKVWQHR